MPRLTETRALRAPLPSDGQRFFWCSEIKGLGVRLTPGSRVWIVQPTCQGGKRPRITLGRVGVLPFEAPEGEPSAKAMALAALVAARAGRDPREAIIPKSPTAGITVAQVWQAYEAAGFPKANSSARKRPVTIRADRYRFKAHFARQIGKEPVASLDTPRVARWLDTLPSTSVRTLAFARCFPLLERAGLLCLRTSAFARCHRASVRTFSKPMSSLG